MFMFLMWYFQNFCICIKSRNNHCSYFTWILHQLYQFYSFLRWHYAHIICCVPMYLLFLDTHYIYINKELFLLWRFFLFMLSLLSWMFKLCFIDLLLFFGLTVYTSSWPPCNEILPCTCAGCTPVDLFQRVARGVPGIVIVIWCSDAISYIYR